MSTPPQVPGYALLGVLGAGATATVWRARRLADGLPVAVKVTAPRDGRMAEALQEAGLLARVRHPHVVHLYDVLPLAAGEGEPPAVALVTQLAAGGSLAQVLARRGLLSPGELVTVLAPVAGALADLHQLGVVHGDVSTGNIVFREDGMPLLADLGTARIVGEQPLRGVGTGAGDGMVAPEVVEGFSATQESDVYQVGALARLALTGEVPGPGFDRRPLAELAAELPEPLVDLVERCMAGAPEDRPDADEVVTGLHAVATPEPVEVAPDADAAHGLTQRLRQVAREDEEARAEGEPGAHRPERVGGGGPAASALPRGRALAGLAVAALVLVLVGAAGWTVARAWWGDAGAAQEAAPPPPPSKGPTLAPPPSESAPPPSPSAGPAPSPAPSEGSAQPPPPPGAAVPSLTPLLAQVSQQVSALSAQRAGAEGVRQTLQELVDARARAWQATDPALLDDVLAEGSPVHGAESAELNRALEAGISYPRVRFEVEDVEVTHEDPDRLEVVATVVRDPLEARDSSGWLLRTPARRTEVSLELLRQEGRWLLWSWAETD